MTFLLSTMYPSALVIISLPSPTFHCMWPDFRYFPAVVVLEAKMLNVGSAKHWFLLRKFP